RPSRGPRAGSRVVAGVTDAEVRELLARAHPRHARVLDVREPGPALDLADERVERVAHPFGDDAHTPIAEVHGVSNDTQPLGRPHTKLAKPDALHAPSHHHVNPASLTHHPPPTLPPRTHSASTSRMPDAQTPRAQRTRRVGRRCAYTASAAT